MEDSKFLGLELELSPKEQSEYDRTILSMYMSDGSYIYLTDDGTVETRVQRAIDKVEQHYGEKYGTDKVAVVRINSGDGPAHNWIQSNNIFGGIQ